MNNVDGYVTRTYYPNGSLQTETQQIANLARTDFATHTYQLQYTYDLGGRRRDLIHPTSLRTGAVRDRTSWAYDPVTGALQSVTDVMGNTVSYGYYDDGSIANATRGNSGAILETMIYDGDGRLLYNDVSRSGSSAPEKPWIVGGQSTILRQEALAYDLRDKLTQVSTSAGLPTSRTLQYGGLGYLVSSNFTGENPVFNGQTPTFGISETFINDGLGNVRHRHTQHSNTLSETVRFMPDFYLYSSVATEEAEQYYDGVVRQTSIVHVTGIEDDFVYDGPNRIWTYQRQLGTNGVRSRNERVSFYGADGKLRADDHRALPDDFKKLYSAVFEEYRYDALGRRTWVRSRSWCEGHTENNALCRLGKIRRAVWDGSSELYEIQMPDTTLNSQDLREIDAANVPRMNQSSVINPSGPSLLVDPNEFFGRVAYTHGLGVDAPVSVVRFGYVSTMDSHNTGLWAPATYTQELRYGPFVIMPLWNSQGRAEIGVMADGGATNCDPTLPQNCLDIFWPRMFNAYLNETGYGVRTAWHGSVLEDKRDASGLLYRRNRQYGPASGTFTQEDPIGLAGGMNLYGFAEGDPVNFADPLGLAAMDITVHGENAQATVDYLRENSASFRELYDKLDADHNVHLDISEQSMPGVINAFHPPGDVDKTWGVIAFSPTSLNQSNYDLLQQKGERSWIHTAASMMSHELAHAGGYYGKMQSSCAGMHSGSNACTLGFENQVRGELPPAARGGKRTHY